MRAIVDSSSSRIFSGALALQRWDVVASYQAFAVRATEALRVSSMVPRVAAYSTKI